MATSQEMSTDEQVQMDAPAEQSSTEIQGVVSSNDVEAAITSEDQTKTADDEAKTAPAATGKSCCRSCLRTRNRRLCCLGSISSCFLLAVAVAVCLPLYWPQDPTWNLSKLELTDEASLMFFVMAFAGGYSSIADNDTFPPLVFLAEVDLYNPNRLGGTTGEGQFMVYFHEQLLGVGSCSSAVVAPRSNVTLQANITVQLYPQVFKEIAEAVLSNNLKLTVQVSGSTSVTGPLGIQLTCGAECDVNTSVIEVMSPLTRHQVIESKTCKYRYI